MKQKQPSRQKQLTKDFFDSVASEWFERTYDPKGEYLKFPSNKARMETALAEINRLRARGATLDVGCGTGELVIALRKRGIRAEGIDVAPRMIAAAKANLARARLAHQFDPDAVFRVADFTSLRPRRAWRAIVALGLLEYLQTDAELFSFLKRNLVADGYALVECRNKFFNLFSANQYTETLVASAAYADLLREFGRSARFSPLPASAIPRLQEEVSRAIARFLRRAIPDKAWHTTRVKRFSAYPDGMVRRQHTPEAVARAAGRYGMRVRHVVYWHAHPYPPFYESTFPQLFNKMSHLMAPLGRTPLGAGICSSFLAVIQKEK